MKDVFLGLGSNLGDRIQNLRDAIESIKEHARVEQLSSVYESAPFGVSDEQPLYLNMALRVTTDLSPEQLLDATKSIERNLGRTPDSHREARPIDIDILLYGDHLVETPALTIPHTEMHRRHFVLVPLEEIASFQMHPALRKPVIDLLDNLGAYDTLVWPSEAQL